VKSAVYPKARGIDCAVKRRDWGKDQRKTSGPTGVTRIKQAEDMTAPTIELNAAK
jgi:hypothetical protein